MSGGSDYLRVHRHVAELKIGRPILKGEVVHHIDGNPLNNDPDNLQVMTRSEHCSLHMTGLPRAPKTHCKRGHPLEGENLAITSLGRRTCRLCMRMYGNGWKRAKVIERGGPKKPGPKAGSEGARAISESNRRRATANRSAP